MSCGSPQRWAELDDDALEGVVTHVSATILRLPDRGALRPGLRADLLVLPAEDASAGRNPVKRTSRHDRWHRAIWRMPNTSCAHPQALSGLLVLVDGMPKMLDGNVSSLLADASTSEPGLEMARMTGRAA